MRHSSQASSSRTSYYILRPDQDPPAPPDTELCRRAVGELNRFRCGQLQTDCLCPVLRKLREMAGVAEDYEHSSSRQLYPMNFVREDQVEGVFERHCGPLPESYYDREVAFRYGEPNRRL